MARFFINVNTVYSVDVDDDFLTEHEGNIDVIADQVAAQYFSGDCDAIDDSIVDFMPELDPGRTYSF